MLEHADIRRILPHRHPILLVDRVIEVEPWRRLVALKTVSGAEPCYANLSEDASPQSYGYPASLMLESFAQSAILLWLHSAESQGSSVEGTLIFAAARDCTFHRAVLPGQTMRHVARLTSVVGGNTALMSGETWVDDQVVAEFGSLIGAARPESDLSRSSTAGLPTRTGHLNRSA
jgi:3-hydroxyacyl-[acyl-carrier-protein] dehydratase